MPIQVGQCALGVVVKAGAAERRSALATQSAHAAGCRRCPLYRDATQAVFGEGPVDAALMFVGEQPGDQEDLLGGPSSVRRVGFWMKPSSGSGSPAIRPM